MKCRNNIFWNLEKPFSLFFCVETLYTSLGRCQKEGLWHESWCNSNPKCKGVKRYCKWCMSFLYVYFQLA